MVNQERHDIDDILKVSDYVRSRGIDKAKKEKREWQNILRTVSMNLTMKEWVRNLIEDKFKGV